MMKIEIGDLLLITNGGSCKEIVTVDSVDEEGGRFTTVPLYPNEGVQHWLLPEWGLGCRPPDYAVKIYREVK